MNSICRYRYPQIVWRDNTRRLWNPAMKKPAANLPEERVRLRFIEAMLRYSSITPARMATEKGVGDGGYGARRRDAASRRDVTGRADASGRTDILCYDRSFRPLLLVECKNETVPLNEAVAEQIARYNLRIGARYLALSNGVRDLWYRCEPELELLDEAPGEVFPDGTQLHTDHNTEYWQKRAFIGEKSDPRLHPWLTDLLNDAFAPGGSGHEIRYLDIPPTRHIAEPAHYYILEHWPEERLVAGVTCLADRHGSTLIVAVAIRDGVPLALLEIRPDLMLTGSDTDAWLRSARAEEAFSISKRTGWSLQTSQPGGLPGLAGITRTLLTQSEILTP
jgi:hypothetical protein